MLLLGNFVQLLNGKASYLHFVEITIAKAFTKALIPWKSYTLVPVRNESVMVNNPPLNTDGMHGININIGVLAYSDVLNTYVDYTGLIVIF